MAHRVTIPRQPRISVFQRYAQSSQFDITWVGRGLGKSLAIDGFSNMQKAFTDAAVAAAKMNTTMRGPSNHMTTLDEIKDFVMNAYHD